MPAHLRFFSPALAVLALGLVDRVCAQASDSPFMPRSGPAASVGPNENLEFAGVNVMATTTYASVYDKQTKKSRWIAVGSSDGNISVLAYDPRREQIVVKSGDIQKTLTLRKATGPANAPAPVAIMPPAAGFNVAPVEAPAPQVINPVIALAQPGSDAPTASPAAASAAKPEQPTKANVVARQEEEARMLVSDLLEIGMAQRKAYEEAQKKAAATETEKPATTPAPAPGT